MNRFYALCAGLGLFLSASSPATAQTHFVECGIEEGNINNATIVIPTASTPDVNGSPLAAGSEIAVFKAGTDLCAGAQVWNDENTTVTVWGDDDQTARIEGLVAGDSMVFRVWDFASGIEFSSDVVEFSYDPDSGLNTSGFYTGDALYVLADISIVDGSLLAPPAPELVAPQDDMQGAPLSPDLDWNPVENASTYHVQVDDDAGFASPEYDASDLTATSFAVPLLAYQTTYHWRVRASGDGGTGGWSVIRRFTTRLPPVPGAPALIAPGDGSSDVAVNADLEWSGVEFAYAYDLEVDDDSDFSSPEYTAAGIPDTTNATSGLSNGTLYQWRVRATGNGGTGEWSASRTFTTALEPAPDAPVLQTPADAAEDVPLSILLDWNAVDGAGSYRLQFADNASFTELLLDETGLETTSVLAEGLEHDTEYFWRVRAAGSGGPSEWSAVWTFTTAGPVIPDAPALQSPSDGASGTALDVALAWSAVQLADSYHLQLDDAGDFSSPETDEPALSSTTFAVTGLDWMTTYHWRVRATGVDGPGPWSTVRSFTTVQAPPPDAPALLLPSDGESGVSVSASIDWGTVEDADVYDLQIHTDDGFSSPYRNYQGLEVSAKIATGLEPTTEYFWRVRARGAGGASPWSNVRSFTTEQFAEIEPPALVSPASEEPGVPKQATLTWSSIVEAQLYHVQVDDDATFISPEFENNSLTVTSTVTSPLSASTHYYWRVRGSGAAGNGAWSEARRFLTKPDPPALLTPTPDSVGVSTNAVFTWAPSPGADRYYFQLDDDPDFSSPRMDINGVEMLSALAPGLESSSVYHWRVRASKNTGKGEWSPARSFTTGQVQAPSAPVTTTPRDGAVDVSTTVILEWTRPAGAQRYTWQLDDDPSFGSPVIFVQNHQGNSAAVPGLAYDRTYYWRVQALNQGGASFWSETASFRTIQISPPAAPSITSPFYGEQDVSARPTLSWSASARSAAYEVQVDDTFGFSSPEFQSDNISATAVSASGLRSETFYYWRVRGLNEGGVSPWSAVGFFTTEFVPIPDSPALVHPSNDAVGVTTSVLLNWSAIDGAYGYHLQVDDDPEYASPIADDDQIPSASIEVAGLSPNATYHWRVRASNPAGFSIWSDSRTFRTAPGAPALLAPVNGSMDIRVDEPLAWRASDGASAYRLQIAGEPAFTETLVDVEGPSLTFSFDEVVLDDNTEYWWRVSAISETGQSDWSEAFRFTTGLFMTVGVEADDLLPDRVRLEPAYPNPFSTRTTFELHLPESSRVVMKMFDMLGREVAHLVGGELSAGTHRVEWSPNRASSGVYVAYVNVEGRSLTRMVTLTR